MPPKGGVEGGNRTCALATNHQRSAGHPDFATHWGNSGISIRIAPETKGKRLDHMDVLIENALIASIYSYPPCQHTRVFNDLGTFTILESPARLERLRPLPNSCKGRGRRTGS
jgi:hypothetical protein